jgi:hypothetical protein
MAESSMGTKSKRPLLIYILIALHSIFGLFVISIIGSGIIGQMIQIFKFTWSMIFVIILFASVYGMWEGKPYGLWCTTFLYITGTLKNLAGIALGISKFIPVSFTLILLYILILVLVTRRNILTYFEVESLSLTISLTKTSIAALVFVGAMFLFFGLAKV